MRLGAFNGLQLLVSSPRSVPAIIITGFADPVLESDARQHGAEYVLKPVTPSVLLDMIRRRLAQVEQSKFKTLRRWERKAVPGGFDARIDDRQARILDISYGGLRFEIPRDGDPPTSLSVRLPAADIAVRADVVWRVPLGDTPGSAARRCRRPTSPSHASGAVSSTRWPERRMAPSRPDPLLA